MRSRYGLASERIPPSASGRYNSEPKIDLQRAIDGWTGFYDFLWAADDKWCKCRLVLRQSVYQIGFAAQLAVLADRTEVRTLIDEENRSRGVHVPLPGIIEMPAVQFDPATNFSIWADLDVRFDIELEGDSFIGFSPEQNSAGSVLLNMPQWKPVAA